MDIIGLGALNFDLLLKVDNLLVKEYEVRVKREHYTPGGSAANTIYGLAKLGLSTGFIGAVGGDWEGETILKSFKYVGVDTKGVKIIPEKRTGLACGLVDKLGRRALYISPRANNYLKLEAINLNYLKPAKILHLTSFANLKQLALQKTLIKKIVGLTKITFAPGTLYAGLGLKRLLPIIRNSEIIFLNQSELKILTGKNYLEGAKKLINQGCKIVAVTLGKKGCYVSNSKESHNVKAIKTKVIDLTGAGDAFATGFLYSYLKGENLEDCGKFGNAVAALCISKLGAREGLPRKEELDEFLKTKI